MAGQPPADRPQSPPDSLEPVVEAPLQWVLLPHRAGRHAFATRRVGLRGRGLESDTQCQPLDPRPQSDPGELVDLDPRVGDVTVEELRYTGSGSTEPDPV